MAKQKKLKKTLLVKTQRKKPERDGQPLSSSENVEAEGISGLGAALESFRTFRETSDSTTLVDTLTSMSNGLLGAPDNEAEHDNDYAAAEAETSHGICCTAARKVGGKRVSAAHPAGKGKGKGKEKDSSFPVESILICPDGIISLGADQDVAKVKDELAVNMGGRYFALPTQVKRAATTLSVSALTSYSQEGLAVTDSNGGLQFDRTWTKEEVIAYLFEKLPLATRLLHQREEATGCPSILTCNKQGHFIRLAGIALPDGEQIFRCTQKAGRSFHGTVLILTSRQKITSAEREQLQRETALQQGNDAVCVSDWDDLDAEGESENETHAQPVCKRKRSCIESDEEVESETEVETQLTSSSPSPPLKKCKLRSQRVESRVQPETNEAQEFNEAGDSNSHRTATSVDPSTKAAAPSNHSITTPVDPSIEAGPSNSAVTPELPAMPGNRWNPDWHALALQHSTWELTTNLDF
ncbi:hypothetical protein BT96DRAFT_946028 [Gymnopus androsaceus JB14]|uniref:Uncharacterized protein n=1 Tax=Gymnopus androsaceus JB14 TaxID=1447944 RepID=A0A6A4GXH7_9AGAR|nr:hypothetical protein BT96DRAFT_946028 [Gymnopus androsaceus JB14]